MPLTRATDQEALAMRKENPHNNWGTRASANRIEPITKPAFDVPFNFKKGMKIFTVGSCFARNVEQELMDRGFDLPMRRVFSKDEPNAILNNYGTPSIYNEFAWAFGEEEFKPEEHIFELRPGRFADLQLSPKLPPKPFEDVMYRRNAITRAYQEVRHCPVVIMTLGLVETWFDTETGYYLNVSPRPSHFKQYPGRFELHTLSFEECYEYLEKAALLIRKHSEHDVQIILTVSPVPLSLTHRNKDVVVANCYSKSVLRAVAETIVTKHDFVTYYPSYESVTLSDRKRAYRDDLIHVSNEIIAFNITRMVNAYVGDDESDDDIATHIAAGNIEFAVEKARDVRELSGEPAKDFFRKFGRVSAESVDFGLEHSRYLAEIKEFEEALDVIENLPDSDQHDMQIAILKAEALVGVERYDEAIDLLDEQGSKIDGRGKKMRAPELWYAFLEAGKATGDADIVTGILARFRAANPHHASRAHTGVGQWHKDRGELDQAVDHLKTAIAADDGEDNIALLYLAECKVSLGQRDEALQLVERFEPAGAGAKFLAERLRSMLG